MISRKTLGKIKPWQGRHPSLWLLLPVSLLILLALTPFIYIVLRAQEAGWEVALKLIFRPHVYELLANTLKLTVVVTALSMVIGLATAWFVERSNLWGWRVWNVIVTLPFAVPAFVSSYSWVSISPIFEGYGGAVLILTLSSYPLVHLPVAATLRGMDPALEEVARSLGYGSWRTFWHVVLPQTRPALFGGALLIALHMLAEFGALSLLRFQTFTTAIFEEYTLSFSNTSAAMLSSVLLFLCLILLIFELGIRGRSRYARVGSGVSRIQKRMSLGLLTIIVWIGFCGLSVLAIGIPLGTLVYWLFNGTSAAFPIQDLLSALGTSVSLGFGGSAFTVLFALPLVILAVRYRGLISVLTERIPYLIHALPGLVIALAFVYFAVHYFYPLYQSTLLLLIIYALLFLPLAQSSLRAAFEQAPVRLEETAQTLNKRPIQVFFTVTLPLIFPGLGAGAALIFLEVMKELTATLLLRPTGMTTLATQVWNFTSNAEFAAAAPYAALLVLVSGLPVYLLTIRSSRR